MRKPTPNDILDAVRQAGGSTTPAIIQERFDVPRSLLHRRLAELTEDGSLEHVRRGLYRLPSSKPALPAQTDRIVEILDRAALDAHVTGLALLIPYVHQFVREFPQLVYAEPNALDATEAKLAANGFVVMRLGRGASPRQAAVEDLSRLALLRAQPNADQYGVHEYLAPAEKAWVDLLRETLRSTVAMQFTELGRILRNAIDHNINVKRLRHYARRQGYLAWIERTLNEAPISDDTRVEAVRSGFES